MEELILNITVIVVSFSVEEYRGELVLNVNAFFCECLGSAIYGGIDT
jgi:hypothetical protein